MRWRSRQSPGSQSDNGAFSTGGRRTAQSGGWPGSGFRTPVCSGRRSSRKYTFFEVLEKIYLAINFSLPIQITGGGGMQQDVLSLLGWRAGWSKSNIWVLGLFRRSAEHFRYCHGGSPQCLGRGLVCCLKRSGWLMALSSLWAPSGAGCT